VTATEAVRLVAGLQAQDSTGPYLGLRARLRDFDRRELTAAVETRELYVATLQRVTLHMVTAEDHGWLKPTLRPLGERTRARPGIAGLDHEALLPRPPAGTAAPVRFLPRFHNLLIAHADRRRVIPEGRPAAEVIGRNTVLVDGVVAGTWEWTDGDVAVTPFERFPPAVERERRRLRDWLADG
jgi:hypothetical protein